MRPLIPALLALSAPAWARPVVLPIQGQLTDTAGVPIDGTLQVTFRLYPDPSSGVPLHTESVDVDFLHGAFTVYLGGGLVLDSQLFNLDQEVWLGVQMTGDVEMELIRVGWTPLSAYAAHAGDAETLDGYGSADFLPVGYRPDWTDIRNRPPGLDDGDNVGGGGGGGTSYTIGQGLVQDGDELSVDPAAVYGWAEQVCYDSVTELRQSLDGVYQDRSWRPAWSDVTNKPAGFADNVDDDTTYQAGDGLDLTGTTFSVAWSAVEAHARGVCYDNEAELHAALSGDYLPASYAPDWSDITNVPPGFADGSDDGHAYVAGTGLRLTGDTFSVSTTFVSDVATDVCYDTPEELIAALAGAYLPADYAPTWSDLGGVPAGFADGIDNTASYVAGTGITIVGNTISGAYVGGSGVTVADGVITADASYIQGLARGVAYDSEAELTAALNDNYLGVDYQPAWSGLTGMPAGFADGIDNTASYVAGTGVNIVGNTISGAYVAGTGVTITDATIATDPAVLQAAARGVCFDTEAELTAVLDDNYLAAGYVPAWSAISGKPAGFADNVDNDVLGGVACSNGQSPLFDGATWTCTDLRQSALTPEDIADLLQGVDVDLGPGTTIDGSPVVSEDQVLSVVESAFPQVHAYPHSPLVLFGSLGPGCLATSSSYTAMIQFPTNFTSTPSLGVTIDESLDNSGAVYTYGKKIGNNRAGIICNDYSYGLHWMAVDRGTHTVDGKMVQAGYLAAINNNDTIFFPALFPVPPVVIIYPENNAWARVIGGSAVSTGGVQGAGNSNGQGLHWIAMVPGNYRYGPYHWEAAIVADPDNTDRFSFLNTFRTLPGLQFTVIDTNNSGAVYSRLIDVTQTNFQIYIDSDASEFLHYVAWEETK
ncbi:MAG TPA: hypothetical protein PKA64_02480 [Myxococcota bacterium]|nr:hypothetical protein [Myxococcota bacterium]